MIKIIHQIWLGPVYDDVLLYMDSVKKMNPEFKYYLWDEKALEHYNINTGLKHSYTANILRLHVLNEYGGFYIDADTIALNPLISLNTNIDRINVQALEGYWKYANGVIYSPKDYDFSDFLDSYIPDNISIPKWNEFLIDKEVNSYPIEEVGREGTILKDIRFSSWKD